MRYTAMIIGFLFATLTAVGAAEPEQPDQAAFTFDELVQTRIFYSAIRGWVCSDKVRIPARVAD